MNNSEYLNNLRHSAAHLLAAAVMELWPQVKRTIGPAIENGFYFDFDFGDTKITDNDFPKIEAKMHDILPAWQSFEKHDLSAADAKKEYPDNQYKHELIDEFTKDGSKVSFYKSGGYWDLCKGGHVENPAKEIGAFKLLSLAGAYWRGDEKNPMLTRIYGTAFPTQKELDEYLKMLEEAKKRDHRKIGKELDLFTFSDLVGSGLPLYTPKGAYIRRLLNQLVEDLQQKNGYQQVWTPQIAKAQLFKTSGHYDKYKQDMFRVESNYSKEEMYLKPMNCPQHTQIYNSQPRSYRDLPLRYTDFAMLYRDERPGELNGLARTRSFSQDDCHIFCTEEQVDTEVDKALQMIKEVMQTFGFKYRYRLSTRDPKHPEKYLGKPEIWDKVEKWAVTIMKRNNINYFDAPGEAAFYAPKMDLMATDALGREWQLSTVQIDFVMPERFNLTFIAPDGKEKHPVILHRAILGSTERMLMILIEHYAGAFPLWLSPVQVELLPIADRHAEYARKVNEQMLSAGIRSEVNDQKETLQAKIRTATLQRTPFMGIIGDKEVKSAKFKDQNLEAGLISVRTREGKDLGQVHLSKFIQELQEQIDKKA